MQKSSIFTVIFCVWIGLLKAQTSSESLSYEVGNSLGYFFGVSWPWIAVLFVGFVIYRIIKRRRLSKSA